MKDYPCEEGESYTTEHGGLFTCLRSFQHGAKLRDERDGRIFKASEISALGETQDGLRMVIIFWGKERTIGYENF